MHIETRLSWMDAYATRFPKMASFEAKLGLEQDGVLGNAFTLDYCINSEGFSDDRGENWVQKASMPRSPGILLSGRSFRNWGEKV